ncbi:hypothetical protein BCR33DRAFT_250287 [Rhizoclosmatium globosum]|uniref:Spindle pole body component n=1 Tax=Rhizoclosmatium globosum TaxID=329046 RepID=A0A1Y2C9W2_9FUNG|nr:hypothetical protein BCR33DRAFT_250287 [Rhizoclosmatium globosum]|eukprot:ORY43822.1 hypothetical protein BCR33DRAFT_250287 [Rhizoclosmatium globosum]
MPSTCFLGSWDSVGRLSGKAPNLARPAQHLSEAPVRVVEAAMRKAARTIFSEPHEDDFMSQRVLIKHVLRMCVGVETSLFHLDKETLTFSTPSRPDLRLEATSCTVIKSILDQFTQIGTHFARLEHISNSFPSYMLVNPTELIFYDGLRSFLSLVRASIMEVYDMSMADAHTGLITVLHRMDSLGFFLEQLAHICGCASNVSKSASDQFVLPASGELLTRIYVLLESLENQSLSETSRESVLKQILLSLFQQVSRPLVDLFSALVGIQNGKVEDAFDSILSPVATVSNLNLALNQIKDSRVIPSFIPSDLIDAASHAGFCLQLLQSFNPNHQLFVPSDEQKLKLSIVFLPTEVQLFRHSITLHMKAYWKDMLVRETDVRKKHEEQIANRRTELLNIQKKREEYIAASKAARASSKINTKTAKWRVQVENFLAEVAEYRNQQELRRLEELEELLQQQREDDAQFRAKEEIMKLELEAQYKEKMAALELKAMKTEWSLKRGALIDKRRSVMFNDEMFLKPVDESTDSITSDDEYLLAREEPIMEETANTESPLSTEENVQFNDQQAAEENLSIVNSDMVEDVDSKLELVEPLQKTESAASNTIALAADLEYKADSADENIELDVNEKVTLQPTSGLQTLSDTEQEPSKAKENSATCSCHGIVQYLCPTPTMTLVESVKNSSDFNIFNTTSLETILEMTLFKAIHSRCDLISQETLLVLVRDLKLKEELDLLGNAFFLNDHEFTDYVLSQCRPLIPGQGMKKIQDSSSLVWNELKKVNPKLKLIRSESTTREIAVRLQYLAKAPFNYILTPDSLQTYNSFFSLLQATKLCLSDLHCLRIPRGSKVESGLMVRFRMESIEFVSSILQYFHEVGLSPWHMFKAALLEFETSAQSNILGSGGLNKMDNGKYRITDLKSLKRAHEQMLSQISWYFLLWKEQKPVFSLLMELFDDIRGICQMNIPDASQAIHAFRQKLGIFVKVVIKMKHLDLSATSKSASVGQNYGSLSALLLFINFNRYYSKED